VTARDARAFPVPMTSLIYMTSLIPEMASQPEAAARRPPDGPDHSDGPAPKKIKTEEAEETGAGPAPRPALPRLDIAAAQAGGSGGPEGATGTPVLDTPTTPHPSREAAEKAKAEAEAVERERMQLLVSSFTEDQLDRCQLPAPSPPPGTPCTGGPRYPRQPSRR
jgi:hypothetical protein